MTINEQIEAAWMDFLSSRPEGHWKRDSFEAGYRAALRDLYREVEPSDCEYDESYWVLTEDGWKYATWYEEEFMDWDNNDIVYENVKQILKEVKISPAELFG